MQLQPEDEIEQIIHITKPGESCENAMSSLRVECENYKGDE